MEPTPTLTPSPPSISADATGLSSADKSFLAKAWLGGRKEITVSQGVMANLVDTQVKALAQQMVTDHTLAGNDLMALAKQKGFELPNKDESALSLDWSKKTSETDRKYVKEMISDHVDAVHLFEEASTSNDPDVAAFAQKTLPVIQHHLMMSQDLLKAMD
jgi:putative membrane protein